MRFRRFSLAVVVVFLAVGCRREAPVGEVERVSDSVFLVRDACNVYVIKRGDRALLVDSGDARVLGLMDRLGIGRIDWVLHTHSHRDQCQGTPRLVEQGVKVAVPRKAARFFTDATGFWDGFNIYYRYRFKPDTFKPRDNIKVDLVLEDGRYFRWQGLRFKVLETQGHTLGSAVYLVELDGRRFAFTGDMIHSPGKLWNLYSFDYKYWDGGFSGVTADLEGLDRVLAEKPDVLLPSHGEPMADPPRAVELLRKNLGKLYDLDPTGKKPGRSSSSSGSSRRRLYRVSEHLYYCKYTSFILLSGDGSALFYDYYAVPDKNSPYYYSTLDPILDELGIKNVEVVIPSHYHEDHIRGFPDLRRRFGTRIWCYENMVDILKHPSCYNLPCLAEESMTADRVLHDGEVIRWKQYEFTIVHFPGQTMYHQGMVGIVDGKKVFFCGDTDVYPLDNPNLARRNLKLHGVSTFLNYYLLDPDGGYVKAMNQLIKYRPELLLFAHSGARAGSMEQYLKNLEMVRKRIELVSRVLPFDNPNLGFDPNWIRFYPYRVVVRPGTTLVAEVIVRNHRERAIEAVISLRLPDGWSVEPLAGSMSVPVHGEKAARFRIRIPAGARLRRRTVVTAEVKAGGRDWGEFAEMLLDRE